LKKNGKENETKLEMGEVLLQSYLEAVKCGRLACASPLGSTPGKIQKGTEP
jgi:hypothetical protein